MIQHSMEVATKDGAMTTFVTHPERGGPYPVILFLMDGAGIREELRDMARRLASVGYFVMLPNLYYRSHILELPIDASYELMGSLIATLTMAMVMGDCDTLLDLAKSNPAAHLTTVGVVGYCMSGQHAVNFAARHPRQVTAAASFHGVRLVTDRPDSPHLMMQTTSAEFYFGCAELDPWAPLDEVRVLDAVLKAKGVRGEVEILKGLDHGFVFPQRHTYDKDGAERHWERLFSLLKRRVSSNA
jgi:carboxymethylenebutenolidase